VLSDQLGVALKQLLMATGPDSRDAADRVLGFEGSDLAHHTGITRMDQDLHEISDRTTEELSRFNNRARNAAEPFPDSKELAVTVSLAPGQTQR
jgi:hypothetical protein